MENEVYKPISICKENLDKYNYKEYGTEDEKIYWEYLGNQFPELEVFWKYFVVPMTDRVVDSKTGCDHREDTDPIVIKLGVDNLWVLTHLISAKSYLDFSRPGSFEYFFIHMASICDLVDSMFSRLIYILDIKIDINRNKENYLHEASVYFDKYNDFSDLINYYVKNDDLPRWYWSFFETKILTDNVLINKDVVQKYNELSSKIKAYRNAIVHKSGFCFLNKGEQVLVPNKQNIKNYRIKLHSIFQIKKIKSTEEFEEVSKLTNESFINLCFYLNEMWKDIIKKMNYAMFEKPQEKLLQLYNIKIIQEEKN